MIRLTNISKHFGSKIAVKNLDLEIQAGEIFAFLGPNGAGKTTTIKMLVGLLQPSAGTIQIGAFQMDKNALEAKECLAYIPDQPYLYDKLTGREQLEFVGRMYKMGLAEIHEKIDSLSRLFEMDEYLDNLCENYSHGMKQRVVFASALLHSPKVLILDEPMVGLDPKSSRIVKNVLKEQAEKQVTIFMSTHSLEMAEETCTRIGIIKSGEMIALGSLSELRQKMASTGRLEEIFLELTD